MLGFIIASLLFSFVLGDGLVDSTGGILKGLRTWWFAIAFVCIGLETRFRDLVSKMRKAALAFLSGQAVNVLCTLLVATALFGGVIFEAPDL